MTTERLKELYNQLNTTKRELVLYCHSKTCTKTTRFPSKAHKDCEHGLDAGIAKVARTILGQFGLDILNETVSFGTKCEWLHKLCELDSLSLVLHEAKITPKQRKLLRLLREGHDVIHAMYYTTNFTKYKTRVPNPMYKVIFNKN